MTKAEARSYIRQQRKQLSEEAYQRFNHQVNERLANFLSKLKPGIVHCFLPITKNREVDTWPVIRQLQAEQIRVAVPKSELETNRMQHFLLELHTHCPENSWGIPEPQGNDLQSIEEREIDLVLLPLLAFDRRGERVGYGKGYYDRFLSICRPDVLKVGLSLFSPVEEISDTSPLDVRLDAAVTAKKVWIFSESINVSS